METNTTERFSPYSTLQPPANTDRILAIGEECALARRAGRDVVDCVVGIYKGPSGENRRFETVESARREIGPIEPRYLPVGGDPDFIRGTAELVFGADSDILKRERFAAIGTPGGTGALALYSAFHGERLPEIPILLSDPTWANHPQIFSDRQIMKLTYSHLREGKYDMQAHADAINQAPPVSVILFHTGQTHNPTGDNPRSPSDWRYLAGLMRDKMALFDTAYAGFGESPEKDTEPIRIFVEEGVPVTVTMSYSKNMGLYGERTGALLASAGLAETARTLQKNFSARARRMWSTPSATGEKIAGQILTKPDLRKRWEEELARVAMDITQRRQKISGALGEDFEFVADQKGLFSLLRITDEQASMLKEASNVYVLPGGKTGMARVNVTGIAEAQIEKFANAVRAVI